MKRLIIVLLAAATLGALGSTRLPGRTPPRRWVKPTRTRVIVPYRPRTTPDARFERVRPGTAARNRSR